MPPILDLPTAGKSSRRGEPAGRFRPDGPHRLDVHPNLNQLYMAGLMTAPMVLIELVLMRPMFPGVKANAAIMAATPSP